MNFKLKPYIGVSNIKFGMKRDYIKNILQINPKTYEKKIIS